MIRPPHLTLVGPAVAAVVVAVLLTVPADAATGSAITVATITEEFDGPPDGPAVAMDASGRALLVWDAVVEGTVQVSAARLEADGTVTSLGTISPEGQDARDPEVAVDDEGRGTVVWANGTSGTVQATTITTDDAVGDPVDLSEAGQPAAGATVDVGSPGQPWAAWTAQRDGVATIEVARLAGDGTVEAVVVASTDPHDAGSPRIAADRQGGAVVAWAQADADDQTAIGAVRIDDDMTAGPVSTIDEPVEDLSGPALALDGLDRGHLVWAADDGSAISIHHALVDEGAVTDSTVVAATTGAPVSAAAEPTVAARPDGSAVAVWVDRTEDRVTSQAITADGTLDGTPITHSADEATTYSPAVTSDPQGRIVLVWDADVADAANLLRVVRLSRDGVPGPVMTTLASGADGVFPAVASDAEGRVTAGWITLGGPQQLIEAAQLFPAAHEGDPVDVAVAVSRERFPDGGLRGQVPPFAVVATDEVFADALGGSVLLGGAPLLLTGGESLDPRTAAEVARLGVPTAYLLGGPEALSQEVAEALGESVDVVRLAGASRVETALAVADEAVRLGLADRASAGIARAFGDGTAAWADSVSGGGWAAATGTPILLNPTGTLHPAVVEWLDGGTTATTVLGGAEAVSTEVEGALPGPERVQGPNRAATAVAVARTLLGVDPGELPRGYHVVDGTAEDGWAYGLVAAGLVADSGEPLLLTGEDTPPETLAEVSGCGRQVALTPLGPVMVEDLRTADADPC